MDASAPNHHIKQIRETMKNDGKTVLEINIKYPQFTNLSPAAEKSINSFYETLAKSFYTYAVSKRFNRANKALSSPDANDRKPFGEALCSTVLCTTYGISVICDVTSFDGIFARSFRFSRVWDIQSGLSLPCKAFLPPKCTLHSIKKKLARELQQQLTDEPIHDYYASCLKDLSKQFSADSFFLTEKGIVFYFQSGALCPQNEGPVCFTIEWDEL